jgi:alkylmercury lyase
MRQSFCQNRATARLVTWKCHQRSWENNQLMNEGPSCWDEVIGSMPEATLAVRRAAFRRLLSGRPALIQTVTDEVGLSTDVAREAADLVVSVGMAEVDDGTIVGMDGLTTRRTRHGLVLDDVELWTWCAYDFVGIAAAVEADAVGRTQCGACGRPIEVVIHEGQPEESTVVGWLPDESCANVMADFCPGALLFCSRAHLDEWRARGRSGSGEALNVESLAERGRVFWGQLVP